MAGMKFVKRHPALTGLIVATVLVLLFIASQSVQVLD
jgi:hypothetical protein